MGPFITDSGTERENEKVREHRYGKMEVNSAAIGKTIRLMV